MRTVLARAVAANFWFVCGRRRPKRQSYAGSFSILFQRAGTEAKFLGAVFCVAENITRGARSQRGNSPGGLSRFRHPPLSCRAFATSSSPVALQIESGDRKSVV